ncbi:MAG: hypothetical protein IJN62_03925 [Clostridia bacterium]|nr:hypothetical protein [Clostridia bacterium]
MTSKELNLKLINNFPEIIDTYNEEISWQDGNDTGSHVIYADVFVPFIKENISKGNEQVLIKSFDFLETLLNINDEYVNEVIAFSVIESFLFDDEPDIRSFIKFIKPKTMEIIKEIISTIN